MRRLRGTRTDGLPEWKFCEVCGSPMAWREKIGKFSPTTGTPERYLYYECTVSSDHMPKAVKPGPTSAYVNREIVTVLVPERPA